MAWIDMVQWNLILNGLQIPLMLGVVFLIVQGVRRARAATAAFERITAQLVEVLALMTEVSKRQLTYLERGPVLTISPAPPLATDEPPRPEPGAAPQGPGG